MRIVCFILLMLPFLNSDVSTHQLQSAKIKTMEAQITFKKELAWILINELKNENITASTKDN